MNPDNHSESPFLDRTVSSRFSLSMNRNGAASRDCLADLDPNAAIVTTAAVFPVARTISQTYWRTINRANHRAQLATKNMRGIRHPVVKKRGKCRTARSAPKKTAAQRTIWTNIVDSIPQALICPFELRTCSGLKLVSVTHQRKSATTPPRMEMRVNGPPHAFWQRLLYSHL